MLFKAPSLPVPLSKYAPRRVAPTIPALLSPPHKNNNNNNHLLLLLLAIA